MSIYWTSHDTLLTECDDIIPLCVCVCIMVTGRKRRRCSGHIGRRSVSVRNVSWSKSRRSRRDYRGRRWASMFCLRSHNAPQKLGAFDIWPSMFYPFFMICEAHWTSTLKRYINRTGWPCPQQLTYITCNIKYLNRRKPMPAQSWISQMEWRFNSSRHIKMGVVNSW